MPILREYAEEFLSTRRYRGRPLAPRTTDLYRWVLNRHVLPYLGERELSTLTPPEVRRWNARLSGPDGPGSNTAAKAYRLLASICATAVADGLLTGSPCTVRGGGQHSSEPRPTLTVTDVLALADAVPVRWRAMILTAAWTGLRFGELAALRRPNLDLDRAQVRVVVATGTLLGGQRVHGKPKTRAGRRTVALPAVLLPELQRHLDGYAQPASDGLIFTGIRGAMLRRSDFCRRVWLPAVAATGLDGAPHPCRRARPETCGGNPRGTIRRVPLGGDGPARAQLTAGCTALRPRHQRPRRPRRRRPVRRNHGGDTTCRAIVSGARHVRAPPTTSGKILAGARKIDSTKIEAPPGLPQTGPTFIIARQGRGRVHAG